MPEFYRISRIPSRVSGTAKAAMPLIESVISDLWRLSNQILQFDATVAITQSVPDMVFGIRYISVDTHVCNKRMQISQLHDKAALLYDIHTG